MRIGSDRNSDIFARACGGFAVAGVLFAIAWVVRAVWRALPGTADAAFNDPLGAAFWLCALAFVGCLATANARN